jgi:hypothetical protein
VRQRTPEIVVAVTVVAVTVVAGVVALLSLLARTADVHEAEPDDPAVTGERAHPDDVYDPVEAGEAVPEGWRQLLPRDRIAPIYHPGFVTAEEADWLDDTLVLGVEIDGDARAYPINVLNRREIVNDVIGDIPVLASW